jgi:hypothetical protein
VEECETKDEKKDDRKCREKTKEVDEKRREDE